ncbi:MAG: LrgB family protein [Clostridium sp.]|nr:LrgB family protein [Clostridium sp.]MCM1400296.1 LrgB family protein [Clostridium sp.]
MITVLSDSLFFGMTISLLCYGVGLFIKDKTKLAIANPILIGFLLIVCILKLFHIPYDSYMNGAKYLSYLLTPATVCLAVPLYEKLQLLRDNVAAIISGIAAAIITNVLVVWLLCITFTLDKTIFATLIPKSITTAIGMVVSQETGGIETITVALICITGIVGNVVAEIVFKLCKIDEPVAKGIAIGSSAHVLGTAKAVELGDTEGAMSGLAVAVAGILTVIIAPLMLQLLY